jgi:hypothetical protein
MREFFLFGCAASDAAREIEICRALAGTPFVLGHGRSGTTLLAQLVNAHPRALVTVEAKFSHFDVISPEQWMAFYEQRFLCSKYLFVFREPKQTILSCRRTFSYSESAISYLQSRVCFVALRADVIRIFPNVIAQFLDQLDETRLAGISTFLGVDLCPAAPLLNPSEQRYHSAHDVEAAEIFDIYGDRLSEIWSDVCATAHLSPALLQADRKRTRDHNETARLGPEIPSGFISVVSTPVGRAWVAANEIMAEIASK